jgi:hypothetical protein
MTDQQTSTPSRAALRAVRVLLGLAVLMALAHLAGCGGGGDDEPEPDKTIDPLVCLHRPGLCR